MTVNRFTAAGSSANRSEKKLSVELTRLKIQSEARKASGDDWVEVASPSKSIISFGSLKAKSPVLKEAEEGWLNFISTSQSSSPFRSPSPAAPDQTDPLASSSDQTVLKLSKNDGKPATLSSESDSSKTHVSADTTDHVLNIQIELTSLTRKFPKHRQKEAAEAKRDSLKKWLTKANNEEDIQLAKAVLSFELPTKAYEEVARTAKPAIATLLVSEPKLKEKLNRHLKNLLLRREQPIIIRAIAEQGIELSPVQVMRAQRILQLNQSEIQNA